MYDDLEDNFDCKKEAEYDKEIAEKEINRLKRVEFDIGYREGLTAGKESMLQIAFDEAFQENIEKAKKAKTLKQFKDLLSDYLPQNECVGFIQELWRRIGKSDEEPSSFKNVDDYLPILTSYKPKDASLNEKGKFMTSRKIQKVAKAFRPRKTESEIIEEDNQTEMSNEENKEEEDDNDEILQVDLAASDSNDDEDSIVQKQEMEDSEKIRLKSRQKYLTKRENERIILLEKEIQDEEDILRNAKHPTEKEIKRLELKKKLLGLALERKAMDEDVLQLYEMPSENKSFTSQKPTTSASKGKSFEMNQVENWENRQIQKALQGVSSSRKDNAPSTTDYDFVFDESSMNFDLNTDVLPGDDGMLTEENQLSLAEVQKQRHERLLDIEQTRKSLPIYSYRKQLLKAIKENQILVIVGETGSGKTTQLPQYLYEEGFCKTIKHDEDGGKALQKNLMIGCTQPRRVAAMSVAARVAEEMDVVLGSEVGYSIRFEDLSSPSTVIKYLTDGMLLRELLSNPDLSTSYSALIIDEAHERTLSTDILLVLLRDLCKARPDFKLLISSATIDAESFSKYFDNCPIFNIPGRRFPVSIFYAKEPEANYIDACFVTILQIHATQPLPGDILVFLTGVEEIECLGERLAAVRKALGSKIPEMLICPIYASLPPELQTEIFKETPEGARKVVLSTNISETSITIDGVVYVIDPGFVKASYFNPRSGMESLVVVPISKASANQRAGRAGRVGPGKAFRLYTKMSFIKELKDSTEPEILRTNLSNVFLLLKSMGINNLFQFEFMNSPPTQCMINALDTLYSLGAFNSSGDLTKIGRIMAEFPLDPSLSKMIIASENYGCSEEILSIAAMLSAGSGSELFVIPVSVGDDRKAKLVAMSEAKKSLEREGGDFLTLLNIWQQYEATGYSSQWAREHYLQVKTLRRAKDVRNQLQQIMEKCGIEILSNSLDNKAIGKSIVSGYFMNSAVLSSPSGGSYRNIKNGQIIYVHPSSSLFRKNDKDDQLKHEQQLMKLPPKFIVYHELVLTTKEYMRTNLEIDPEWLQEISPHWFSNEQCKQIFEEEKNSKKKKLIKPNIVAYFARVAMKRLGLSNNNNNFNSSISSSSSINLDQLVYPHRLNLYTEAPMHEKTLSLELFEKYAYDRLQLLKAVDSAQIKGLKGKDFDKFVHKAEETFSLVLHANASIAGGFDLDGERSKDVLSHFILRLALARSPDSLRWMLNNEVALFKLRLNNESAKDKEMFLNYSQINYEIASQEELIEVVGSATMSGNNEFSIYYKVPFEHVPDLISKRLVVVSRGMAFVSKADANSIIISKFKENLETSLEITAKYLPRLEEDDRLFPILQYLSTPQALSNISSDHSSSSGFLDGASLTAFQISNAAAHFPPCMQRLQNTLKNDSHLKYQGRQQYGLFLKSIGLPLEEALLFWKSSFATKLTEEAFNKNYAYNIRHNYGQEGKRANYAPWSCVKIITGIAPSSTESHGCPFKHLGLERLSSLLTLYKPPNGGPSITNAQISDILSLAKAGHYQLSCTKLLELTRKVEGSLETILYPSQFYEESIKKSK